MPVKSVPQVTEPVKNKLEARIAAAETKFSEWNAKWEKYHEKYVSVYMQIMTETSQVVHRLRHSSLCLPVSE